MKRKITVLGVVFSGILLPSAAHCFLGATPEQCIEAYGKPSLEVNHGDSIRRSYGQFNGFAISVSFKKGKAVHVRYKPPEGQNFQLNDFLNLLMVNQDSIGKSFTFRKEASSEKLSVWETDDKSALMLVNRDKPAIDITTMEEALLRADPQ